MSIPLPIAVLISGGGTTLKNLLERSARGELSIDPRLVISSHPEARGLEFANEYRIATRVIEKGRRSDQAFSDDIFSECRAAGVELVCMGGFLKHVLIPNDFENRVMNVHPSLIPAFCGQGFYGLRVHQAVLDYGAKVTGCTIHFVDNEYDHGPIILQRVVEVQTEDSAETLAKRVFAAECQAYAEAIEKFAKGQIVVVGRQVLVKSNLT